MDNSQALAIGRKRFVELERAEKVATAVWNWLQTQKTIELVPWAKDPMSEGRRKERKEILDQLEQVIQEASKKE